MILALLALAFADDASMTVIVEDDANVERARAELDELIREQGYLPGIDLGQRVLYMPIKPWKPKVTFHEQGSVRVKARAVTPMMVTPGGVSGVWGSPRMARELESRLLQEIDPKLDAYKSAVSARGQAHRREALFAELEALNELSPKDAWAGLAALWLNTADNAEGEKVRILIEEFAVEHRLTGHPLDVAALNAARTFPRAWEPEYLGHQTPVENPELAVEPFSRPEKGPRCPEKPKLEATGLAADILYTVPVETSRVPEDWVDLATPNDAEDLDPRNWPLPPYSCPR